MAVMGTWAKVTEWRVKHRAQSADGKVDFKQLGEKSQLESVGWGFKQQSANGWKISPKCGPAQANFSSDGDLEGVTRETSVVS